MICVRAGTLPKLKQENVLITNTIHQHSISVSKYLNASSTEGN